MSGEVSTVASKPQGEHADTGTVSNFKVRVEQVGHKLLIQATITTRTRERNENSAPLRERGSARDARAGLEQWRQERGGARDWNAAGGRSTTIRTGSLPRSTAVSASCSGIAGGVEAKAFAMAPAAMQIGQR